MEEEFGEEDDCYDIRMELMVNGLPLTTEYSRNGRKDGLYVPSGELVTIVGPDGITYVSCTGNYEVLETKEKEAAPLENVYEALERKFKMTMAGDIAIHEMRLVYYPFPLSADQKVQEYEFIPAWCFTFSYDGIPSHVYVNAVTGEEIVE